MTYVEKVYDRYDFLNGIPNGDCAGVMLVCPFSPSGTNSSNHMYKNV